jgi:hypothetical protein
MVNPLTAGFMASGAVGQINKDRQISMNEAATKKNIEQIDMGNFSKKREYAISQLSKMKDAILSAKNKGASPEKLKKLQDAAAAIAQQTMKSLSQEAQILGLDPRFEIVQPIEVALQSPSAAEVKASDALTISGDLEAGGISREQAQAAAGIPRASSSGSLEIEKLFQARDRAVEAGDEELAGAIQSVIDRESSSAQSKA